MKFRMRIGTRISGSFILVMGILLVSSAYNIFINNKNKNELATIQVITLQEEQALSELEKDILRIQMWMTDSAAVRSEEGLEEAEVLLGRANKKIDLLVASHEERGDQLSAEFLLSLKAEIQEYFNLGEEMVYTYLGGGYEAGNLFKEDFNPIAASLQEKVKTTAAEYSDSLNSKIEKLSAASNFAIIISIISNCIAILSTLLISIVLSRSIVRPMKEMVVITELLAKGSLTLEFDLKKAGGNYEIALLGENLNKAISALGGSIESVKKAALSERIKEDLSGSASETSSAVTQMSTSTELIRRQIDNLDKNISGSSTVLEQILSTISSLADQINSQSSAVEESSASVEEMTQSINNVAGVCSEKKQSTLSLLETTARGAKMIDEENRLVSEVARGVDSMMEMAQLINNIASQTNLLSINAAIEAAHSGTEGKGFAVVASEIRKLAESTAQSASSITKTLQNQVKNIRLALDESIKSREAFSEIQEEVGIVVKAFEEIAWNTSEMATGTKQILAATVELTSATSTVKTESDSISGQAKVIHTSMQNLKEISSQIIKAIDEFNLGMKEIDKQSAQVLQMSQDIGQAAEGMNQRLEYFQTA